MAKLAGRLAAVASLVPSGARVLDVGCDHGYVSIHLVRADIASEVHASDMNPGPLDAARRNAARYNVSDRITFHLADGIPTDAAGAVDTVIIAGMGGETIAGILSRAPDSMRNVRYILQPQTKLEHLIAFLSANGFSGLQHSQVTEGRRIYTIITANK